VVAGEATCGTCTPRPASQFVHAPNAGGFTDARPFPAGPKRDLLVCYSGGVIGIPANKTVIDCTWADQATGDVIFFSGFAADLADAATMTSQIRAAVEG
jgi:hypothetical protein